MPPSPANRTIRVFISSTFRDMHAERDHLVTVVFPELRERIERLGLEFFDVDLRWGVPEKDVNGETANSWEYCRQWIDRVEPLFVCILGERYGWVPEVGDFKDEADRQRQVSSPRSITDLEVRHAVLTDRRKRRSYFYLRETPVPALSAEATAEQRKIHEEFVDPPERLGQLEALKTEVRGCGRPVRDYQCRWTRQGFKDLDSFGQLVLDDLWSGILRDERYVSKEIWRQVLGTDPDTDPRYTDESHPVPEELADKIVSLTKPAPASPLDAELQQMDAFAASRLRWFQGRVNELLQLTDFIRSTAEDAPRLAVVATVPGQGKSALLASLHEQLKSSPHFVITHFVGATERSATAYALVERLLAELDRSGITWPEQPQEEGQEPKRDFNSLCLRLAQRLGDYTGERRIVILLDALNQMSDGHDLLWLPSRLASNVRVIASCISESTAGADSPEHRVLHALTSRQPAPLRVALGPLNEDDVRTIVVSYLREYCHELDREHLETVCAIPQARNPLYLLVMLNELRTLGGNDLNRIVPELIASMPDNHPDTVSLFRWVLQRLEVFGAEAVRWWCLYLAHGRVGMASHELADLLGHKLGSDASRTALLIERGLRRYLQRRGPQLDFFHGQLRQAVLGKYRATEDHESELREYAAPAARVHHEMAEYFTSCARGDDSKKTWDTEAVRGFSECVYHFTKARDCGKARRLLSDFPFLLNKIRVGLLEGVFEDYKLFEDAAPADDVSELELHAAFFRERAHILRRGNAKWPAHKILLQLAVEHADDSPVTLGAEQYLADGRCDWLWLRNPERAAHAAPDPCLAVLEGHRGWVEGALALPDGRFLSWSWDETLRLWSSEGTPLATLKGHYTPVHGALALPDGRFLSWSNDSPRSLDYPGSLRLWSSDGLPLATPEGHASRATGALALADGRFLSWSDDRTLRLWSSEGTPLATLEGHTSVVNGALVLPDSCLLSWSEDRTLRLWSSDGAPLATLEGHTENVRGALALADGRFLSWSDDKTLRLWSSEGAPLATLEGHASAVRDALALLDGRFLSWSGENKLVSCLPYSSDMTLRLWSPEGAPLATLEGHTGHVLGALALANGRFLSWSSDDTLRLWTSEGAPLATLEGHTENVLGALALPDGRVLSWSDDATLRLWSSDGAPLATLDGHTRFVSGALALQDGRFLSWSHDKTLRLWSLEATPLASLKRHTGRVVGALTLPDDRFLLWSADSTLRLCSSAGALLATFEGHTGSVRGALALANGRFLSWSSDDTLRLWTSAGAQLATLEGHRDRVYGALALPDGRSLSWSADDTLRLWSSEGAPLATFTEHAKKFGGALALPNGRLLSWSDEKTLRLWTLAGAQIAALEGHRGRVSGALALQDGRFLSWSADDTLRLWTSAGDPLATLEGHTSFVSGALALPDGRLLSWSNDRTLRFWSSDGAPLATIEDPHQKALALNSNYELLDLVRSALAFPDGRFLLWYVDEALRLWSSEGALLQIWPKDDAPDDLLAAMYNKTSRDPLIRHGVCVRGQTEDRHLSVLGIFWHAKTLVEPFVLFDGDILANIEGSGAAVFRLFLGSQAVTVAGARGLEQTVREEDSEHDETLAQLVALSAHLRETGQIEATHPSTQGRARLPAVAARGQRKSSAGEWNDESSIKGIGPYILQDKLGEGSLGEVYAAFHMGRPEVPLAVKLLRPVRARDPKLVAQFRREAELLSWLRHPNICAYVDSGIAETGRDYLVMERLTGEPLRTYVGRPWPQTGPLLVQALRGLVYLADERVLHRGLSPSDIFVVDDIPPVVKLLGFGLAEDVDHLTQDGTIVGVPAYLSPEAVDALGPGERADWRSDLYSMGCICYEVLTGSVPFAGDSPFGLMKAHLSKVPSPPKAPPGCPALPDDLALVIMRMLEKRRENRPSYSEAIETFERNQARRDRS